MYTYNFLCNVLMIRFLLSCLVSVLGIFSSTSLTVPPRVIPSRSSSPVVDPTLFLSHFSSPFLFAAWLGSLDPLLFARFAAARFFVPAGAVSGAGSMPDLFPPSNNATHVCVRPCVSSQHITQATGRVSACVRQQHT